MADSHFAHDVESLPVVRVGEIALEASPRRWLIEGLWRARAVGLIGGHPKVGKTFLALDMAVSVASGTACLGAYRVVEPGPALVYLAEDSLQALRERTEALSSHRRLPMRDLDLHVITSPILRLDLPRYRACLLQTLKLLRPRILILDPLVRLHNRHENDATEISELLSYLRHLERELEVAVVLVHHARKSGAPEGQLGQSLRGSGDLWAWSDSTLYLRRSAGNLILSMEHRAAPSPESVCLRLVGTGEAKVHLEVVSGYTETASHKKPPIEQALLETLRPGQPMTREQLRATLSVKNERLGEALTLLERQGLIERTSQGWRSLPGVT